MVPVWRCIFIIVLLCGHAAYCTSDRDEHSPQANVYKSEFKDPLDPFDTRDNEERNTEEANPPSLQDPQENLSATEGRGTDHSTDQYCTRSAPEDSSSDEKPAKEEPVSESDTMKGMADVVFTRRIISSLLNHITQEADDGEYTASLSIPRQSLRTLRNFAKSDAVNADEATEAIVNSVNFIGATRPPSGGVLSWLMEYENRITSVLQVLLIICITMNLLWLTMSVWKWLRWRQFLIFVVTTSFLVSVPWTWIHLYKQNLAKRLQRADQNMITPPGCDPQRLSITNFLWTGTSVACQKYYQDQIVDPLWEIKPTAAIAVTFVEFFWEPLRIMGDPLGEFIREVLEPLPFYLKPVVCVLGLLFLWWCLVLVSGMRVWTWFFTVEPAVTAQHQLTAMQHTVDEMQQCIQEVGNSNAERDARLQGTLERLEQQAAGNGDVQELLPVLYDMCAAYGQGRNNMAAESIQRAGNRQVPQSRSGPSGPAGDGETAVANERSEKFALNSVDHIVITTDNIPLITAFYKKLGMTLTTFGDDRKALHFGTSKINIHKLGEEIKPHAKRPTPGGLDICLVCSCGVETTLNHLRKVGIDKELGPDKRTGAQGSITSVYIRDPDQNLIELAHYKSSNRPGIANIGYQ